MRMPTGWRRSLLILGVAIAGLILMALLLPASTGRPWLALALFVGLLATLRLLGQFEKPA